MRVVLTLLIIIMGSYAALALMVFLFQSRLVFHPGAAPDTAPAAVGLAYEETWVAADDGVRLHGWYLPSARGRGTALFFHGNAGNIGHRLDTLRILHELGLHVLILDYRGYGRSQGRPSEAGLGLDARAAWRHLVEGRGERAGRIVVWGRSLGGAVAAGLAAELGDAAMAGSDGDDAGGPAGLVLESTFTSAVDMGRAAYPFLPVRLLARFSFDTAASLSRVRCPVLVMHAPGDEVVPFRMGRSLFAAAPEPKQWAELAGGHNDGFLVSGAAYTTAVERFLISLGLE